MSASYDVIVIGGGTGGLVTASGCARLGRSVALIERASLGGDCLWTGCVPTKALVASARLAHQMRNATRWGLEPVDVRINPRSIMESMRAHRQTISRHDDPAKFRALGVDVIEGHARLAGKGVVEVDGVPLRARDIVVATGARTAVPDIPGLEETGYLDHATFLDRDDFPPSVLILGGGYIGIEFAQLFARFGSQVTVVETGQMIAKEDPEMIARVRALLLAEGIEIVTSHSVRSVRGEDSKKVVTLGGVESLSNRELAVDEIFVASGRRGNTDDLGLETAGVTMNRSWITVDRFLRTSVPRVWACGDVHGGMQFTHVAAMEGVKLVRNILFPGKSAVDYSDVPWTLYTDPELAHVGMTEPEARDAHGENVRAYRIEMNDVDRAVVDRGDAGMIKLVCDTKGQILGAHVLSTSASTVIQEIVNARRSGVRVGELAQRISSYPSLSDGVQKAASKYYEEVAAGWLGRLGRRVAKWSH